MLYASACRAIDSNRFNALLEHSAHDPEDGFIN